MAIKILFDVNHNPIMPTMLLSSKSGKCYGMIDNTSGLVMSDCFNDTPSFSIKVAKYDNGKKCNVWDSIADLKLVYCVEWDYWFEIEVELDDGENAIKTITAYGLGESETAQIMLYDIEINTENDILRDDYSPTVIYNEDNASASLLNRLIDEKAPHYKVGFVDHSLRNIQRVFEFNDTTLHQALLDIASEIGALVVFDNSNDMDLSAHSNPKREISFYDLKNVCNECGERFDIYHSCPKCGSTNYKKPYGKDTLIFISKDNLTDSVIYSTNVDAVKNCFRLVAGDDLMTSTIKNCNPNGSQYIWHISDEQKADMPSELVEKIESYNAKYEHYRNENVVLLDEENTSKYNQLVNKYKVYNTDIQVIPQTIVGYSNLMKYVYDTIDFDLFLSNVLMETVRMPETSAQTEAAKLHSSSLSPVAVSNADYISAATADNCVLEMARVLVDSRYRVKIENSTFSETDKAWTGTFIITNYSDDEDTATSNSCRVFIADDYEHFIRQKIDKVMAKSDTTEYSITTVMKQELTFDNGQFSGEFTESLKKYSLMMLEVAQSCCQSCIDVLIEQGVGNKTDSASSEIYDSFYKNYYNRLQAIEQEMSVREKEIEVIQVMQESILDEREKIQEELDFESYIGKVHWKVFCSYRRDDKYENTNFISDGLTNAELFQNALEFIENAEKEIYKSSSTQHTISSTLHNLLFIKDFEKLVDHFEVGNWIRVEADETVYKLRLLKYEIDFDNPDRIEVEFSDVEKYRDGMTDIKSVLEQASSMASSYPYVSRQSSKGKDAFNTIDGWTSEGMELTSTKIMNDAHSQDHVWDEHGFLFRQYNSITGDYEPTQLKIINSTLAVTDDYWETVKTAIGKFLFRNPETNEIETAYGVNGETIIGNLIMGEKLAIYNSAGTLSFNKNGLSVENDTNKIIINPNAKSIFNIKNGDVDIFSLNEYGGATFVGDIVANSLTLNSGVQIPQSGVEGLSQDLDNIKDSVAKSKQFLLQLTNDYQAISIDSGEFVQAFPTNVTTSPYVTYGSVNVTNSATFTFTCSSGVTGNWNEQTKTYTVTDMTEDNGYVDISCSYTDENNLTFTATKRFSVSKIIKGIDGTDGLTYYTWVKYADDELGTNISDSPINKTYIGFAYNKLNESASNSPEDYTWSLFKGSDGLNGASISIISTSIEYAQSTSGTETPNTGWGATIPSVDKGQFLWTKTTVTYSDQTETISYSVAYKGIDGENGNDGISYYTYVKYSENADGSSMTDSPNSATKYIGIYTGDSATCPDYTLFTWSKYVGDDGKNGNGIDSITYYYATTTTQTAPDSNSITATDIPDLSITEKYLWQKEVIDFSDPSVSDKTTVTLLAVYGDKGIDGTTYYTWVKYSANSDGSNMTNSPVDNTKYIGIATNKTTLNASENVSDYTWSLFRGSDGTSVTITDTSVEYVSSDSGTATPTTGWEKSVPNVDKGKYLWTKTTVLYSDNTETVSYSVAYKGTDGTNGTNGEDGISYYTYVKYSVNENGSDMVDSPTEATKYIGIYTGTSATCPTYTEFTWSKYVGQDGTDGKNGNGINSITYYYKVTETQSAPDASTITDTTMPTLSATNKYLWQKEVIDFTDSTVADKTSVVLLAVYGDKGQDGNNGVSWDMELSDLLVVQNADFTCNPETITAKFFKLNSTSRASYSGRLIVRTSVDGSTWTTVYTANSNISTYTFTLPKTSEYNYIRFDLYAAGGTTTLLDQQTVAVTHDIICSDIGLGDVIEIPVNPSLIEGQSKYFRVSKDGLLQASNAIIYGTIYADKGIFNGEIRATEGYFGGENGISIDGSGKVVFGTNVELSFDLPSNVVTTDNYSTVITKDYIQTMDLSVNAANITGTLTASQIDATNLSVNAANISGQLTASQINATGLSVSAANITGKLTASQIDASNLTVGYAVTAGDISATTITGKTITGGSISGTTISGGSISGTTISGGTITGTTINSEDVVIKNSLKMTYGDYTNNYDVLKVASHSSGYSYVITQLCGTTVELFANTNCKFTLSDINVASLTASSFLAKSDSFEIQGRLYVNGRNIFCGDYKKSVRYVQVYNYYHNIQMRAGDTGHVGIMLDYGTADQEWLIYKDKDGTVRIPGFSGGVGSVDLTGYATQDWVTKKGYITASYLSTNNYVTTSYLSTNKYITRDWIDTQGFVKQGVSISSIMQWSAATYLSINSRVGLNAKNGNGGTLNNHGLWSEGQGKWIIFMDNNKRIQIGENADHNGTNVYIGKNTFNTVAKAAGSDRRLKNDYGLLDYSEARTILKEVPIVKFMYKNETDIGLFHNGIYAQDLRDVIKKHNFENRAYLMLDKMDKSSEFKYDIDLPESEYYYSISYIEFVPLLWKGWQVHDDEIDTLKNENAKLTSRCEQLQTMVEQLFDRIARLEKSMQN